MGGHRNVSTVIVREDIVQDLLGTDVLVRAWLGMNRSPVRVVLGEPFLEAVCKEVRMNISLPKSGTMSKGSQI